MVYDKVIKGTFVDLRAVTVDDAEFILDIRQDENLTKYLPRLDITAEQQRSWIRNQIEREGDYYFIVVSHKTGPVGTIRAYNLKGDECETGSLAIRGESYENIEAKLLCDRFAFEVLGVERTHNIIKKENLIVKRLAESFGVEWVEEQVDDDGQHWLIGCNSKERFMECSSRIERDLKRISAGGSGEKKSAKKCSAEEIRSTVAGIMKANMGYIDFESSESMVDDKVFDSLSMVTLIALLSDEFGINIPFRFVNAENFNSIDRIASLIYRILNNEIGEEESSDENCEKVILEPLKLDVRDTEKTIVQRIFEHTASAPDSAAIIANDKKTTYQELSDMIISINKWLGSVGITTGDSVAIESIHDEICIACYYAVHLAGAKFIPLEARSPVERMKQIAGDTNAKVIISTEKHEDKDFLWVDYDEIRIASKSSKFIANMEIAYPDIDLPCEMIFTTGTTGKSKGVLMTHRHVSWYAYSVAKAVDMKYNNRFFITTPLNHAGGLRRTHLSLANGCCVVYLNGISDLSKYFKYIREYGVTSLYLPPVAIRILASRTGKELSKYKDQIDFVYSSSSPLPESDCIEMAELLPNTRLYNAYEASETPGVSVYDYNTPNMKKGCIGKANEGVSFGILTENGEIVTEPNVKGQLCVKSRMNMKEYYLEPELTKSVWQDGWFVSSDLGVIDEEGNAYYNGRKGDIINIGGYKIAPNDVEEAALRSGMIVESICIEALDEYGVQYLKLLVVVDNENDFDSAKLTEYLSSMLEGYKIPRKIEIVGSIQKTFNGKIDRKFYR